MKRSRFITQLASAPFFGAIGLTALGKEGSGLDQKPQMNGRKGLIDRTPAPILQRGARVAITAPASALAPRDSLPEITQRLKTLEIEPVLYPSCSGRYFDFSATDQQRADELHQAFEDPTIDGVMALRGGWGAARLLPILDFERIASHPKPLIGYSDITSLHLALQTKTSMISYHGPTANASFPPQTSDSFWTLLSNREAVTLPLDDVDMNTAPGVVLKQGQGTGPLLGGNLTVLCSLLGTEWMPSLEGAILCIEDVGESVYRIDRMLTQLQLAGHLDNLNGLLLGTFVDCEPRFSTSPSLRTVVEWITENAQYPVWMNAPFGHIDKQWTLPIGSLASLDTDQKTLVVHSR